MKNLDFILFVIFPYVAISVELSISIYRYTTQKFKFSSLSSEFLENRSLFWGSVPWHYGILGVLGGHILAFCFPQKFLAFGSIPMRLLILEITALAFGLMALTGLVLLIKRRFSNKRIRVVTTGTDFMILLLLLLQVATGVIIATKYRWGSTWYAAVMVPYLRSIFTFNPDLALIKGVPWMIKLHMFNAMVIIAVLPFTRLIHFLVLPVHYLWRSWQVVIWNWDPEKIRKPNK